MRTILTKPIDRQGERHRFVWVYQNADESDDASRYSVDIYDLSFRDEFGNPLCVAAGIDPDLVEESWHLYLRSRRQV